MILCPWLSYLIAESLGLSGIVAILINGICLANYATPNLKDENKRVLQICYTTAAHSCETTVFIFLGVGLFSFKHPFVESFWLILLTILVLNLARACNILIVSVLVNICRKKSKIGVRQQFVMWISGLRGAMAYALAMKSTIDFEHGDIMLVDTLVYSLLSVLVIGSLLNLIIRCTKVYQVDEVLEHELYGDSIVGNPNLFE